MFLRKPLLTTTVLVAAGVSIFAARVASAPTSNEFEEASMTLKVDTADEDIAIEIALEVAEAFLGIIVHDPFGDELFSVMVSDNMSTGLTELMVEAKEYDIQAGLAAFPSGTYTITALNLDGTRMSTYVDVSHDLPARPTFISPTHLSLVDASALQVTWMSSGTVDGFVLVCEGDDMELTLEVPADVTSFTIPASLLEPGATYELDLMAVNEAGNSVVTEIQIRTAP